MRLAYPLDIDCADGELRVTPQAAIEAARAAIPSLVEVSSVLASDALALGWNATVRMVDSDKVREKARALDRSTVLGIVTDRVAIEAVDALRSLAAVTA